VLDISGRCGISSHARRFLGHPTEQSGADRALQQVVRFSTDM